MLWVVAILCTIFLGRVTSGPLYFFATFPGVLLHELAHFLVASVLNGRPGPIRLFPRKADDGSWELGSVTFYPSCWNAGFVALAPLYVLPALGWVAYPYLAGGNFQDNLAGGYLLACLVRGTVPSSADWTIAFTWPLGTALLLIGAALLAVETVNRVLSQSFF